MAVGGPLLVVVADHGYSGGDVAWLADLERIATAIRSLAPPAATSTAPSSEASPRIVLQLRAKEIVGKARPPLLRDGLAIARRAAVTALVNGTAAEAADLGFDGVHWAEASIPSASPPAGLRWRSASVHSLDAARRAVHAGARFVIFGPVFPPGSKHATAVGIEPLRQLVRTVDIPVVAIGGVDRDRAVECLEAGAAGVAVVSAVFHPAADAVERLAGLHDALLRRPTP